MAFTRKPQPGGAVKVCVKSALPNQISFVNVKCGGCRIARAKVHYPAVQSLHPAIYHEVLQAFAIRTQSSRLWPGTVCCIPQVIGHDGFAYNITMKPGDLVLYESHSIIHGRPYPLKGRYFSNIFVHFEASFLVPFVE